MAIEYLGLSSVNGPFVVLEGVRGAAYDEIVEIVAEGREKKLGRIVEINNDKAVVQVFEVGCQELRVGDVELHRLQCLLNGGLSAVSGQNVGQILAFQPQILCKFVEFELCFTLCHMPS